MWQDSDNEKPRKSPQKALETLEWLCSKMERCPEDVRRSLYRWGIDRSEWEGIIDKLKQNQFIDEQRYTRAYIREKLSVGRWGTAKITAGLRAKRIDRHMIELCMSELVDSGTMDERLERQLRQRVEKEQTKERSEYQLRATLFRWAASRGFDFDQINTTLNKILKDEI